MRLAMGIQKHRQGSLESSIFAHPPSNLLAPEKLNVNFASMEPAMLPQAGPQPHMPGILFPYSVRAAIKPCRKFSRLL